jgi:hypothetical protein
LSQAEKQKKHTSSKNRQWSASSSFSFGLSFFPEERGDVFLRNVVLSLSNFVFCICILYVYFYVLCLIVVTLPPGEIPFGVQLNNTNIIIIIIIIIKYATASVV